MVAQNDAAPTPMDVERLEVAVADARKALSVAIVGALDEHPGLRLAWHRCTAAEAALAQAKRSLRDAGGA